MLYVYETLSILYIFHPCVNVGLGWAILDSISLLNFSFDYQVLA